MTSKIIKTDWGIKAAHNDKDSPRGFFRHKIIQIKVLETENQIYILTRLNFFTISYIF